MSLGWLMPIEGRIGTSHRHFRRKAIVTKREFLKGSAALAACNLVPEGMTQTASAGAAPTVASVLRENWAGTFHYSTDRVLQPTSIDQVQQAVNSLPRLRALGTRHSFNGIADSTVAQISTLGLNDFKLDPAAKTVTVGPGIKYGDLAVQLDKAGFALANLASLPHISVGGSIATATHGSGLRNGNLATSVSAIEFVAADGNIHTLTRAKDGDTFRGAVVGLGSLGIVTHVTLDIEPTYNMTQVVYRGLDFHELEHNFEAIMNTGHSLGGLDQAPRRSGRRCNSATDVLRCHARHREAASRRRPGCRKDHRPAQHGRQMV
jgi:xylitol oxidase